MHVRLKITTATEVVLAQRAADVAHRAFVSMFLETEALPERHALLARRRPRSSTEGETWLAQVLWCEGEAWTPVFEHDTARVRFLGRGRDMSNPAGIHEPLSGTTGTVLDPLFAMRRTVRLEPGSHARMTLTTALGSSRAQAHELVDMYATPHIIPRAFELAWADARVELKHLGISAAQSHRFQRLLSAVIFPQHGLRGAPDRHAIRGRGRSALWTHGLTSDLPILVVRIDDPDFSGLFAEVILAHEHWRLNGVTVDLVALNDELPGYMQPQHEMLMSLVRSSPAAHQLDQRGGVFLRRSRDMTDEERALLIADARVVLHASRGSLARQLRRIATDVVSYPDNLAPEHKPSRSSPAAIQRPSLEHDNGLGGFTDGGKTYTMTVQQSALPPMPWSNVMANAHFGSLVSESGASFTWFGNSQRHRLTPWSNDPISDPSGEIILVRDDDDGSFWSVTPQPAGGEASYLVRHGQGWSSFAHTRDEVEYELSVYVHPVDAVKTWRLRIANKSGRARQLSIFGIVEWVLGSSRERSRASVMTEWDAAVTGLMAINPLSLYPERHAFWTATGGVITSFSGDREDIFGAGGSRSFPAALERTRLSGRVGSGLDPCGALHVEVGVDPGETIDVAFLLGEGDNIDVARSLVRKHRDMAACTRALADAKDLWSQLLGAVTIKTPDAALDTLVNHWLLYQVTSCRLWGRSAFYQSGGAFGFRDQIQDVLALLHARPDLAREHLLRAAARQFVEGDVQHWWHAGSGEGVRTRCSDDMLWLPYAVAEYVLVTGDRGILEERVGYLKERALTDKDEDIFSIPAITQEKGTLYEHCARALDAGTTAGEHGLPKMGSGDWNDGMNRVGREGKGESVWLAWFLAVTARHFSALAELTSDHERVASCAALIERLGAAVSHAWDGAWYRRAFFDDGTPLGSHENTECRIDAIAQSWSVIAGIGDPARARQAVESSERELVRTDEHLIRLLWPPFDKAEPDPGYIRAYPTGIRENGGQYTHGVLWTVQALALLGEGDRAVALLSMLNPINHAATPTDVARYQVEPYVVAADVYDSPAHVGRGGWTWYTGSASVMYRVVLDNVLGIKRRGSTLTIDPCIAKSWPGFEVTYRDGDGAVHIVVDNSKGVERGVERVELDGRVVDDRRIPLTGARGTREVRVVMGSG